MMKLITSGLTDVELILAGDFFTDAVLAAALTKLVLRFDQLETDNLKANALCAEVCDHARCFKLCR